MAIRKITEYPEAVLGQVGKPGAFPLVGNETILQLLTRSGGLSVFADRSNIRVVRRERDKITEYVVDYDAILKGDLRQDILLRPGDRVGGGGIQADIGILDLNTACAGVE